ncbi:MAG TPA: DMT family transporter [Pseudonocardiaceae bacterium]|jgi:drug/metabolite transporter (DMT)-like permease|nr:DMT family transporter [Pseudonocardiaceae bacterium]
MSLSLAVFAALGASASSAVASALLHRSAVDATRAETQRGGTAHPLLAFARATATHRLWLTAVLMQATGFLLHAVALHAGQLAFVQPMLVCALLFALPFNRVLLGEPVTARELYLAGALVVGLCGFLFLATPSLDPPVSASADPGPATAAGLIGVIAVVCCLIGAGRQRSSRSAALLGAGAGVAFAGQAALLKACTAVFAHRPVDLLTTWQLYALIVVGLSAVVLNQLAFRAGPLSASLPVSTTVNPVLGVVLGAAVYDENLRHTTGAIIGELCCLALLTVSALALTRLTSSSRAALSEN